MCLIQEIFNRGLARASLPALVVLTWGMSKGHRGINRIDIFVTWTKVRLGLVTGSKPFHCRSLLFATFWENVLVPKKCFSAPLQGIQERPRGDSCLLCRPLPSHWQGCGCSDARYVPRCAVGLTFPRALGGLNWHPIQTTIQP